MVHWSSCKVAHVRQNFQEGSRPNIGRKKRDRPDPPVSDSLLTSDPKQNDAPSRNSSNRSSKQTLSVNPDGTNQRGKIQTPNAPLPDLSSPGSFSDASDYETLSGERPHPDYLAKGPIISREMFNKWSPDVFRAAGSPDFMRPRRSTRNPNPNYKD